MQRSTKALYFSLMVATFLTSIEGRAAAIQIPPCPDETEREFLPNAKKPLWASCKDEKGLYQGLLIQFSTQTEIIRVAGIKNSEREGREIRFGETGTLEERSFKNGHLDGPSFIFKSEAPLGRVFPKAPTQQDWQKFQSPPAESILKTWMNTDPVSSLQFTNGRLVRVQFEKTDYQFRVSKEGRIYALNHPQMKGLFFFDPEPLWDLNAADTKSILKLGFGSCKKYDGPLGRYGRYYDVLLFRKETAEKKHLARLTEMRDRLIHFCLPEDLEKHLGKLECPPQLPSSYPQNFCLMSLSDQLHIPYEPKYFTFELTLGRSPEEINALFKKLGVLEFMSKPEATETILQLSPQVSIALKKTSSGLKFKLLEKDKDGKIKVKKTGGDDTTAWWDWLHAPGF